MLEKIPGQSSYEDGTRNGVKSFKYGSWPASFKFRSEVDEPSPLNPEQDIKAATGT